MKWWLAVYILTINGWEPGENFDGWWSVEQASYEACEEHRDFANQANFEVPAVAKKICFVCEQRSNDGISRKKDCREPCTPCEQEISDTVSIDSN